MTCKCGKLLIERTIATKTRKMGGDLIVLESKTAQVCESCGVVAWGALPKTQPRQFPGMWPNPIYPQTGPAIPARGLPTSVPVHPATLPRIIC